MWGNKIQSLNSFTKHIVSQNFWTDTYGLSRSLLATGTFLTILFNPFSILVLPGVGLETVPVCKGINTIGILCLVPSKFYQVARIICLIILFLVIIGWRPRWTCLLHWWVSFSFLQGVTIVDGGDQVANVISLLLIPICLTDNRKWHWSNSSIICQPDSITAEIKTIITAVSFFILKLQVAFIYLHASIGKLAVIEWRNGTALYYYLTENMYGISTWLEPVVLPLLFNPLSVVFLTWGVILLEFLLFVAVFLNFKKRKLLFLVGLSFHFMIIIIHGLVSFFFSMAAALTIYLLSQNKTLSEQFSVYLNLKNYFKNSKYFQTFLYD